MSIVKALADASRVRSLLLLRGGELCVCQIIEMLGLAPSTVSKHMNILRQAGLVESRKEGRWIYYRLPGGKAPAAVRGAVKWVQDALSADPRITADTKSLGRLRKRPREDLSARCYGKSNRAAAGRSPATSSGRVPPDSSNKRGES